MAERTIVYWRDIPAQVVVRAGRRRVSGAAAARFTAAIDA
ncbi:MAG: virulence factor, partial [Planctomycetes bacterium]|nr:virulence factor [Planctomycetota bacterium]